MSGVKCDAGGVREKYNYTFWPKLLVVIYVYTHNKRPKKKKQYQSLFQKILFDFYYCLQLLIKMMMFQVIFAFKYMYIGMQMTVSTLKSGNHMDLEILL